MVPTQRIRDPNLRAPASFTATPQRRGNGRGARIGFWKDVLAKTAANLIAAAVTSAVVFGGLWWIVAGLNRPVPRYVVVIAALGTFVLILGLVAASNRWRDRVTFSDLEDDERGFLLLLLDQPDSYISDGQLGELKRMRGWDRAAWNAIEYALWRQHFLIGAVYSWRQRGQGDPVGWELLPHGKALLAAAKKCGQLRLPASWDGAMVPREVEPDLPPPIPGNWVRRR